MTDPGSTALERTREVWDRNAPRFDREMNWADRVLFDSGREWACAQVAGDILEVAVGTGRNLALYGPGVTSVTGIDLSPSMLAIARDRARQLSRDADLRIGNAQELDFGDDTFDTVICTLSLCSVPDDRAAIREMYRVLKPGGRLVLFDHVASDRWWVRAVQKLLERVTLRTNCDYQTRRPLPLVAAQGFMVSHSQRSKLGWVERLVAVKPRDMPGACGSVAS